MAFALSSTAAFADAMDDLVAAAKAEGELTTIALPHDWCGYGGVIDGFKAKYGLKINELNPDAGSGDEIEAIKANKDNKGPQAPDVIDVGLSFGPSSKAEGLIAALQGFDLGHDSRQRQGCGRLLVRRLLWRAGLPGEQGHHQEHARPTGPTCRRRSTRTRSLSPVIRAPPTRPSWPSMLPALPAARLPGAEAGDAGLEFFKRAECQGQPRADDRQIRLAGAGRHADHHRLGL